MRINKKMLKLVSSILFVLFAAAYGWITNQGSIPDTSLTQQQNIRDYYHNKVSGRMVLTSGVVSKILRDDNEGSRHQRFIVNVDNKLTVLVAHNIDLAPRVPLQAGHDVEIFGQYEWNEKGGVLHWTHHDPRKQHEEGWIKFKGQVYQ